MGEEEEIETIYREQNGAFRFICKWNELKEKRQGHPQKEETVREGEEQRFCLLLSVIPKYEVPCYHCLVLIFSLTVSFIIRIMPAITSSLPGIL